MTFADLWRELESIGRDPQTGGYRRYSWTPADTACRTWFTRQAAKHDLADCEAAVRALAAVLEDLAG